MSATAAVFAMGGRGHIQRLRPLVAALVERGVHAVVLTDAEFEADIRHEGADFVDLFAGRTMSDIDGTSRPMPLRYVSFAGHCADDVVRQVRALRPSLVVADSFALIGRIVAAELGVPYVNVCSGHNVDPDRFVAQLEADPRIHIDPALTSAIDILRDRYGLVDASAFSYVRGLSDTLNLYCEPPQFLTADERAVFEPVAFFGSLPSVAEIERRERTSRPSLFGGPDTTKIYISFGTVVWWSTPADPRFSTAVDALAGVQALASTIARRSDFQAVISLGGTDLPADVVDSMGQANVRVERYVDQWQVLRDADVFVTHHGLNSTHESIANLTPMLSYPFIWDQPALAARCQKLGVARPLAPSLRAPLDDSILNAALDTFDKERGELAAAVERARQWELDTVAERPAVIDALLDLM